jgi:hypothetical protein
MRSIGSILFLHQSALIFTPVVPMTLASNLVASLPAHIDTSEKSNEGRTNQIEGDFLLKSNFTSFTPTRLKPGFARNRGRRFLKRA